MFGGAVSAAVCSGLDFDEPMMECCKWKNEKEKLIEIAIRFLDNPKIASASLIQKKMFLKKKGLTNEDVELVFT